MTSWIIVAAGVLAGVAYTVSPLTALFALSIVPLFLWAAAGVEGRERRWLLALLVAAVLVRVAAVSVLLLATNPAAHPFRAFVPDARFAIARSWWIRNQWLGIEIGPVYRLGIYNPYGATSYAYVLAAIQLVCGQSPYGVNFVAALTFFGSAIGVYRVVRHSFGALPAFIGLTTLLFWPTMIVWSVSALRESFQLALSAIVLVGIIHAVRRRRWIVRVAMAIGVSGALAALSTLRSGAIIIVAGGMAIAIVARAATIKPIVARLCAAMLVIGVALLMPRPAVQQRFLAIVREAVMRHVGEVATTGNAYKVLDYRFYADDVDEVIGTLTPGEALDFVIRSGAAFFLVPLPWQLASLTELAFFPQQVCWLLLVACGAAGILAAHRRDPLLTWLFLGYIGASVAVIAPNSGNIGTLVRHRDVVMLALVWLSAVGLCTMVARYARGHAPIQRLNGELATKLRSASPHSAV